MNSTPTTTTSASATAAPASIEAGVRQIDFQGQPALSLTSADGAQAIIALHGATVISWIPAGGEERMYLSETSVFDGKTPIRGGAPILFPQFGTRGPGVKHGIVRNLTWQVESMRHGGNAERKSAEEEGCFALATLSLSSNEQTRALWPHDFNLELCVMIGGNRLDMELEINNSGTETFSFTTGLHTYLRVKDVETINVQGLRGTRYLDARATATDTDPITDTGTELVIDDEVDRIYIDAPEVVMLQEPHRALAVRQEGFLDTVVWNPWEHKGATFSDMPKLGFKRFLCIEAGSLWRPQVLPAGSQWIGRQSLLAL